jgi:diguanylate cyclase (GGDEF)-like protein/PAS domain S-box-containing protein
LGGIVKVPELFKYNKLSLEHVVMKDFSGFDLKSLLENAHIGVVIHTWDTSIVYANPTAQRLLRLSSEQIIDKDAFDPLWTFVDDAGRPLGLDDFPVNKVRLTETRIQNDVIGLRDVKNNSITWFMVNAYPEQTKDKSKSFIVVTFNDITESKELYSLSDIIENTQDMVIITDAKELDSPFGPEIVYVNKAVEKITGYAKSEVIGETPRLLQGELTDKDARANIKRALLEAQPVNEILLNYNKQGRPYWIDMNIFPLKNKYGDVTHFAAIERDISEQKFTLEQLKKRNLDLKDLQKNLEDIVQKRTAELQAAKIKLESLAYYDALTNIPNRRYFIDQAPRVIKSSQRRNLKIAFGLVDIDNFKAINDDYGHNTGDVVLTTLGQILSQTFRGDDLYCRYGGEEFSFAVNVDSKQDCIQVAERLLTEVRGIRVELDSGEAVKITISIGIDIFQPKAESQVDFEYHIKLADKALYKAKAEGKDRLIIYQQD